MITIFLLKNWGFCHLSHRYYCNRKIATIPLGIHCELKKLYWLHLLQWKIREIEKIETHKIAIVWLGHSQPKWKKIHWESFHCPFKVRFETKHHIFSIQVLQVVKWWISLSVDDQNTTKLKCMFLQKKSLYFTGINSSKRKKKIWKFLHKLWYSAFFSSNAMRYADYTIATLKTIFLIGDAHSNVKSVNVDKGKTYKHRSIGIPQGHY